MGSLAFEDGLHHMDNENGQQYQQDRADAVIVDETSEFVNPCHMDLPCRNDDLADLEGLLWAKSGCWSMSALADASGAAIRRFGRPFFGIRTQDKGRLPRTG